MARIELDIQGIRAKTIEEFAERLKEQLQGEQWTQFCTMRDMVDEIAKQMKAGDENA